MRLKIFMSPVKQKGGKQSRSIYGAKRPKAGAVAAKKK